MVLSSSYATLRHVIAPFSFRITSYNVCYTKLLRSGFYTHSTQSGSLLLDALSIKNRRIGDVLHHKKQVELDFQIEEKQVNVTLPSLDFKFKSLPQGWEMQLPELSQMALNRITSYNVCYTKLLRPQLSEP